MSEPWIFSDDAVPRGTFLVVPSSWTYTSSRDDDGNLVIRINITQADRRETTTESVVAYNLMGQIKQHQSVVRGGRSAAAGSPPVVPQPPKAPTEKASDGAQTKLHLQALKDISKTTFWWQAQKIAKAMLKDVGKPSDEDGERYMVALEKVLHTAHHQEAVGIAAEAQKPLEKQSEVPYDWGD